MRHMLNNHDIEGDVSVSQFLSSALAYLERGFSVIPLRARDKRPLVHWEPYQSNRATTAEIGRWWTQWPDANVGLVTGALSGVVVIDLDTEEAKKKLEEVIPLDVFSSIPRSLTGKGWQLFFQHPGFTTPNRARVIPGLDVRGDGGLSSRHRQFIPMVIPILGKSRSANCPNSRMNCLG